MSWVVKKKLKAVSNTFPKEFVLISTPKCGGYTIEKIFKLNGYRVLRPEGLNLTGHYTFLDTYSRLKNSKYSKIKNYLIPVRETISWRMSYYQYVKHQPNDSGMRYLSEMFNNITFEEYIENLVEGKFENLNSNNNLAVIPRGSFLTNNSNIGSAINDVNIFIYDMTNGFSELFKNYFNVNIENEFKENQSKVKENLKINDNLKNRLLKFDNLDFVTENPYTLLNKI